MITQLVVLDRRVEWLRKIWTEMVKFGLSRDFPNYKHDRTATSDFPLESPHKWPSGCLDLRILGPRSLVHVRNRIPCAFGTSVLRQDPDLRRHRKFFLECTHSKRWNLEL
jgi:hypothetical protein